jgi:hypothetical protein
MKYGLVLLLAGLVSGCASSSQPLTLTTVATDVSEGLAAYQAALGAAEQAASVNPAVAAKIQAVATKAAPYVALAQTAAGQASTAQPLATLSAQLLLDAAPYIVVKPNQ